MSKVLKKEKQWWVHTLLIVASAICVFPLYRIFTVALRPGDKIFSTEFYLWPDEVSLDNFRNVFLTTNFFTWIFNSTIITIMSALISVSLSATAAYGLSRYKFPM